MTKGYEKIKEEYLENVGDGYYPNEIATLRLMELERMDNIANELWNVGLRLEHMCDLIEILARCVTIDENDNGQLIIRGYVDNHNLN